MSRLEVILGKEKHTWGTLKEKATPAYIEQKCAEMFTIDDVRIACMTELMTLLLCHLLL